MYNFLRKRHPLCKFRSFSLDLLKLIKGVKIWRPECASEKVIDQLYLSKVTFPNVSFTFLSERSRYKDAQMRERSRYEDAQMSQILNIGVS